MPAGGRRGGGERPPRVPRRPRSAVAVKYLISAAYDYTTYTVRHENTTPPYFGPHFSNDSARAKREEIQTETRGSRVPVPVGRTPGRDRQPLRVHLRRHLNAVDIPDMRASTRD